MSTLAYSKAAAQRGASDGASSFFIEEFRGRGDRPFLIAFASTLSGNPNHCQHCLRLHCGGASRCSICNPARSAQSSTGTRTGSLVAANAAVVAGLEDAAAAEADRVADVMERFDLVARQPGFFERIGIAWNVVMGRATAPPLPRVLHHGGDDVGATAAGVYPLPCPLFPSACAYTRRADAFQFHFHIRIRGHSRPRRPGRSRPTPRLNPAWRL